MIELIGNISDIASLVIILATAVAWFKGILPAVIRLGLGLAKRKIVVFAKSDNATSLINLLTDSKLISKSNISQITKKDDFEKASEATLFLVYWPDWKKDLINIKNLKRDSDALVIYAPKSEGYIPDDLMAELDSARNVTVVNFRGRLLNDIVTAMITTGYTKG